MTTNQTHRVRIVADTDPESPREYAIAKMVCNHSRYDLGDVQQTADALAVELATQCEDVNILRAIVLEDVKGNPDNREAYRNMLADYTRWGYDDRRVIYREYITERFLDSYDAWEKLSTAIDSVCVWLPLYLYDHSGITMSTGPFSCPWDSGQVGIIYLLRSQFAERYGKEIPDDATIESHLKGEVAAYDQYLTGDIYGFIVEQLGEDGEWETIDSCWGFYGDDPRTNGMADYLGDSELLELACAAEIEYPSR